MTQKELGENTRQKILDTATDLFAAVGFSGTSMSKLAQAAQVNQSLIFHHFKNKDNLWLAVKAAIVENTDCPPITTKPNSLRIFLEEAINQRIQIYKKNPQFVRLISWQRLETASKTQLTSTDQLPNSPYQWLEPIKYLQQQKQLNRNFDPLFIATWLTFSINGLTYDDLGIFKNTNNKNKYIEMLIEGFLKAFA